MKWHDYRMVIPEEEKQYLCCQVFGDVPYAGVSARGRRRNEAV